MKEDILLSGVFALLILDKSLVFSSDVYLEIVREGIYKRLSYLGV